MKKRFTIGGVLIGILYAVCLMVNIRTGGAALLRTMDSWMYPFLLAVVVSFGGLIGSFGGSLVSRVLNRRRCREEERLKAKPSIIP